MPDFLAVAANDPLLPEDAFEQAWNAHLADRKSSPPELSAFLPPATAADYRETLFRLIAIDIERRLCSQRRDREQSFAGDTDELSQGSFPTTSFLPPRPLQEYLQQFQISSEAAEIPELVAAEYEARRRAGQRVHVAEYFAAFPRFETEITALLKEREAELNLEALAAAEQETPHIPGFTIQRELGRGGMSVVYLATEEGVSRLVAIKISLRAPRSAGELARYELEPKRMAKLPGHGVVEIHRTGIYEGRPYLICKYLAGGSLVQYLRSKEAKELLKPTQAAAIIRDVARTMQEVHQRGVVHRDLKPENILLDEFENPHVMDFGLSWDRTDGPPPATQATEGTPPYMPPEQAANEHPAAFAPAVDIYSLGATLYWALTGKPPFIGSTVQETLRLVSSQEPVSPRQANPALSRDLETICLKCLEKKPARRYATTAELADDLDRFLRNEPVRARPISGWERLWRWGQRNPVVAALIALAVFFLISGTTVSAYYARQLKVSKRSNDGRLYSAGVGRTHQLIQEAKVGSALRVLDSIDLKSLDNVVTEGFEWDYALRLSHNDRWELGAHQTTITGLAVSAASGLVASADSNGVVRLMEGTRGRQIAELKVGVPCEQIALSPFGEFLAVATADSEVRIWRITNSGCQLERTYTAHVLPVQDLVFHPSHPWLATTSFEGKVRVFDVTTGEDQFTLSDRISVPGTRMMFEADGEALLLLMGSGGGAGQTTLIRWQLDLKTISVVIETGESFGRIRDAALSSDGKHLFLLTDDQQLRMLTKEQITGWFQTKLKWQEKWRVPARSVGEAKDRLLVAGGDWVAVVHPSGEALQIHLAETGRLLRTVRGHTDQIVKTAANASGDILAVAARNRMIKVWNGNVDSDHQTLVGHAAPIRSLAISPDGNWLASGGSDFGVICWDVNQAKRNQRLGDHSIEAEPPQDGVPASPSKITTRYGHRGFVTGVAFSRDSQSILSVSWDRKLIVWDASTGKIQREIDTGMFAPSCLAMAPSGNEVIVCGSNGPVLRFDWRSGKLLSKWGDVKSRINFAAYDPRRPQVATGTMLGRMQVRDLATGKIIYELPGFENGVRRIAYSADGKWLAAGGVDRTIHVWRMPPKSPPIVLDGHTAEINGLTFLPDGRLVSSSRDDSGGSIKLWDLATQQELMSLPGEYFDVVATPDGTRLISSLGKYSTIRILDSRPIDADPRRLATSITVPPRMLEKLPPPKTLNIKPIGWFVTDTIVEDMRGKPSWIKAPEGKRFLGVALSVPISLEMATAEEFRKLNDKFNDSPGMVIDQAHASLALQDQYRLMIGDKKLTARFFGPWPFDPQAGVKLGWDLNRHLEDPDPYERALRLIVFEIDAEAPTDALQIQMRDAPPVPVPGRKLPAPRPTGTNEPEA